MASRAIEAVNSGRNATWRSPRSLKMNMRWRISSPIWRLKAQAAQPWRYDFFVAVKRCGFSGFSYDVCEGLGSSPIKSLIPRTV